MTGPEHFREAENCIEQGSAADEQGAQADAMTWLALGQLHATLALAAAFACARLGELPVWDADAWQDLAGTQPDEPDVAAAPGATAEDTRRLGAIRGVLAAFDWEHDDRQLALEAIERIVDDEDQADEPEPEEYDPGPEVDDEGGMSEYRYMLPEDYQRGQP